MMAPKGYQLILGPADVVRGHNDVYVGIIRLMLNAILFVHATEVQYSEAAEASKFPQEECSKTLKKALIRSVQRLGEKLNLNFESVIYLMHQIIHNLGCRYTPKWGEEAMPKFTTPEQRGDFEAWLVAECIKPVTKDTDAVITSVRNEVSSSLVVRKWSKRFEGDVDLKSDEGRRFEKEHLINVFLPFRLLTLSIFKEAFLQTK